MEIDIILLGILSGGDFFGYEIMKIMKAVMLDIAEVTTGTLYYKLKRLEEQGWLSSVSERKGLRPQRRRYLITDDGRSAFERLALENIAGGGRPYWPYLSSLFFVQYLPTGETVEAIRLKAAELRMTLARLHATDGIMKRLEQPFHARLLVEHGMRHLEVDIEWLEKFARTLSRRSKSLRGHLYSRETWEKYMSAAPPATGETR